MTKFEAMQLMGNDAGNRAAVFQNGIGYDPHETDAAATKNDADAALSEGFGEFGSGFGEPRLIAFVGATKDCNRSHCRDFR